MGGILGGGNGKVTEPFPPHHLMSHAVPPHHFENDPLSGGAKMSLPPCTGGSKGGVRERGRDFDLFIVLTKTIVPCKNAYHRRQFTDSLVLMYQFYLVKRVPRAKINRFAVTKLSLLYKTSAAGETVYVLQPRK